MLLGKVVDELLDEDRLANAGAPKEASLAATDVGLEKVDGLDASLEDLGLRGELVEGGSGVVDGVILHVIGDRLPVDGLTHDVPHAAQRRGTNGHHHGVPGVLDAKPALQAVGRGHSNGADDVVGKLGLDLEHRLHAPDGRVIVDEKCRID